MKNALYVIAGLVLIIWGIIYWGLNASSLVHLILLLAILLATGNYFYYNSQKRRSIK